MESSLQHFPNLSVVNNLSLANVTDMPKLCDNSSAESDSLSSSCKETSHKNISNRTNKVTKAAVASATVSLSKLLVCKTITPELN